MWSDSGLKFNSRRSPILGRKGMVASSQPYASQTGLNILKKGGNAVDAAIAMAAVLNGLGGDCFMLYYEAKTKKVHGLNGSGRCPSALTLEKARAEAMKAGSDDEMDCRHVHCVTVPGTAAGWCDSIDRFGSQKMSMSQILEPAITLAEEGFPVSPVTAYWWGKMEDAQLNRPNNNQEELLSASTGHAPIAGEIFRNPTLARCMQDIGRDGKKAFYEGRIADAIVDLVQLHGGVLTKEDLATHESTWVEAISTTYGPVRVWEIPPNGQGLTALIALNLLTALRGLEGLVHNGPEYLHQLIEVMRLAFADTRWYIADPSKVTVPVHQLLSPEYATSRIKDYDPAKASADVERGQPTRGSHTVSFQVVDGEGNAVSFVNSNYMNFGTGLVPKGCGFRPYHTIIPGLATWTASRDLFTPSSNMTDFKPYHTIIPGLATWAASGYLFATFSNMGGFMQPQGHVQILLNLLQFNMDPQTAVDQPRFAIKDGTANGAITCEEGIDEEVVAELEKRGHVMVKESREGYDHHSTFGKAQIITRDPATGVLWAGSDGRGDGCAMGW